MLTKKAGEAGLNSPSGWPLDSDYENANENSILHVMNQSFIYYININMAYAILGLRYQ